MSEPNRAKSVLHATIYFQDAVLYKNMRPRRWKCCVWCRYIYIYYHKACLQKYLYKYESLSHEEKGNIKLSPKQIAWSEIVDVLEEGLNGGKGYELSVIRDHLNTKISSDSALFYNGNVKIFLINHFGDTIDFTYPVEHQKSMMVFNTLVPGHVKWLKPFVQSILSK